MERTAVYPGTFDPITNGHLDLVAGNTLQGDRVWLNDGVGNLSDSGQALGVSNSYAVALGDVDGDGDLDALVMSGAGPAKLWLNGGSGTLG